MLVFRTATALKKQLVLQKKTVGLVPTMGALHAGHISLVEQACKENDLVIVSIYVNPTQFNVLEDLENYPRNLDDDQKLLQPFSKKIFLYVPENEDLYPNGVVSKTYGFGSLAMYMEGLSRPGHYDGVATIVEALLKNTSPARAYFGEKDFQQLQIIRALNTRLHLGVEIIECPLIREKNGLAMSSRNQLLPPHQREVASVIYKSLEVILQKANTWSLHEMKSFFVSEIEGLEGFRVDYFAIASPSDLIPVKQLKPNQVYRVFVAVYVGKTRLIDTVELKRI